MSLLFNMHYVFSLFGCPIRPFVLSDIVTTISHELLEQFWSNWWHIH